MKRVLDAKRSREIQKVITPSLLGLILDELKMIRGELKKANALNIAPAVTISSLGGLDADYSKAMDFRRSLAEGLQDS